MFTAEKSIVDLVSVRPAGSHGKVGGTSVVEKALVIIILSIYKFHYDLIRKNGPCRDQGQL